MRNLHNTIDRAFEDIDYMGEFNVFSRQEMGHALIKQVPFAKPYRSRIIKLLKYSNVNYIKELTAKSQDDLMLIPGMSEKYIDAITEALDEIGLALEE